MRHASPGEEAIHQGLFVQFDGQDGEAEYFRARLAHLPIADRQLERR